MDEKVAQVLTRESMSFVVKLQIATSNPWV